MRAMTPLTLANIFEAGWKKFGLFINFPSNIDSANNVSRKQKDLRVAWRGKTFFPR
jgi:hypothetical protein